MVTTIWPPKSLREPCLMGPPCEGDGWVALLPYLNVTIWRRQADIAGRGGGEIFDKKSALECVDSALC